MKFGSVCSGIEAASVAWHQLGWQAAWLAEIEPFPCAVLAHHYPTVPNLGDMTTITPRVLSGEVEAPDVFTGGTPCQAFSVAGQRRSLDDARGNLSLTFCEIADAIDHVRTGRGEQPAIIVWENVPGVLSTKDNAFGCFLGALAGEDCELQPSGGRWTDAGCVLGSARTVAWRVLDAQYFGVAQRRRRVFVVASSRKGFDPAAVLFESEGVRRDSAPSRGAREVASASVASSFDGGRWPAEVAATLDASFGRLHGQDAQHMGMGRPLFVPATANAITASMANSCLGHNKDENVLAFDAYNQTPTGEVSKTVAARDDQDTASLIAFHHNAQACQLPSAGRDTSISDALTCSQKAAVAVQAEYYSHDYCQDRIYSAQGIAPALNCSQDHKVRQSMAVRRLTPRECEGVQGFPDDYTMIPWKRKPAADCPDGPRYKALGNSWAVPCARWIGERIAEALK